MLDLLIRLATLGMYLALAAFAFALVLSTFSKRANHVLNCGKHTMKVCQGDQVFLVCYDCGLRIGKGWDLAKRRSVHEAATGGDTAGRRPDGLRLLLDSSGPGAHLRGGATGRPGGELA